jgi:hypothetical protein
MMASTIWEVRMDIREDPGEQRETVADGKQTDVLNDIFQAVQKEDHPTRETTSDRIR